MMTSKRPWLAALAGAVVVVLGAVTVTQLLRAPVDAPPVPRLTPAGAAAIAGRPPAARVAPAEPLARVPAPLVGSGRPTAAPGGGDRLGGPDGDRNGTSDSDRSGTSDGDRNGRSDGGRLGDDRPGGDRHSDDRAARARDGREDRARPGRREDPRPPAPAPGAAPGGPAPAADPAPGGPAPAPDTAPGGPAPVPDPAPGGPAPAADPAAGAPSAGTPGPPSGPPVDPATGLSARAPGRSAWADPSSETPEQRKARLGRELALSVCDRYGIPRDRCPPPRRSTG